MPVLHCLNTLNGLCNRKFNVLTMAGSIMEVSEKRDLPIPAQDQTSLYIEAAKLQLHYFNSVFSYQLGQVKPVLIDMKHKKSMK